MRCELPKVSLASLTLTPAPKAYGSASALNREPAARPGIQAAVEINGFVTSAIEKLGNAGGSSTHRANADDPVVDLVKALHQLVHGNVHRAGDATVCPFVIGANIEKHPALGHPRGDLARLHARHLISKHHAHPSCRVACGPSAVRRWLAFLRTKPRMWPKVTNLSLHMWLVRRNAAAPKPAGASRECH
jgi:hypothetical protein